MSGGDDAAARNESRKRRIEVLVPWIVIIESEHHRCAGRCMPGREKGHVRCDLKKMKVVDIFLEEQVGPGPSQDELQGVRGEPRSLYRKEEEQANERVVVRLVDEPEEKSSEEKSNQIE